MSESTYSYMKGINPMKNKAISKQELSHDVVQDIRDSVNKFLDQFDKKTADASDFLTMDTLEDLLKELDSETRKTYLNMVSDAISSIDEKELIKSKKENSPKRG